MMLAETFLRQFAPLVSSTNGIQKLRELVLQLAVRGKLVPQKTSDGHASDAAKKALQNVPDKIKRQLGDAGQPHPIPENWVWVTLGAISNYGETDKVDPGTIDDPDFWILELEDIEKSTSRLLARVPFQERNFRSSKNRFKEGQVLYGKLRPYLDKVIVADRDGCCTPEIVPFSVFGGIDPYFIRWCMKTPAFISYADGSTYGMNLPRMGTKSAIAAPIPLPPIAEQKRIVAKVNELMALCDELEAQQAKETELKRATAASALHHLNEAKTPEETAERWSLLAPRFGDLFDDLETIKALRGALSYLALRGELVEQRDNEDQPVIATSELKPKPPYSIPKNWRWVPFSRVAKFQNGDRSKKYPNRSEYVQEGVPWINTGHIEPDGSLSLTSMHYITEEKFESLGGGKIQPGDLVYCLRGATFGKTAYVEPFERGAIASSLMIIRPGVEIDRRFAFIYLTSPLGRQQLKQFDNGTAQPNLSAAAVKKYLVPLPPLAEQKRIVVKVYELTALCDRMEEQVREGERLKAALMGSLVHALTETDPDGGGAVEPTCFTEEAFNAAATDQANKSSPETLGAKSAYAAFKTSLKTRTIPNRAPGVDTKFQEAVLVAAIVNTFFQAGGEPIGNFRLQKAVYFARRRMGEHVGEMAYLKKAAGPYNPSMKYSGGIAIAKQKNWLREARGRFGFGHVPGTDVSDAGECIDTYGYDKPARWVAEHFRYKKNEEWETLATIDYAIEHLQTLSIEPDAVQILQYIASDPEWRPKIEKLRLTEMSVGTAMLEVQVLFGPEGGDK